MIYSLKKCAIFLILNYFFFFVFEIINDVCAPMLLKFHTAAIPVSSAWFFLTGIEAFASLAILGALMDAMNYYAAFGITGLIQIALYFFLLGKKNIWWNLPHKEVWVTLVVNVVLHLGLLVQILFFNKASTLLFTGTIFSLLSSLLLTSGLGLVYLPCQKRWIKAPKE